MNIQNMILTFKSIGLNRLYFNEAYDTEKGAGTMSPYTFLRHWTRALERSLRGTFEPSSRWSLWRKSKPLVSTPSIPSYYEAITR